MTRTRRTAALIVSVALAGVLLGGCSTSPVTTTAAPATTAAAAAVSTAPVASGAPVVETPTPVAAPIADEFSQVVGGVLYAGTEKAPVRIGTDVVGQAPAVEAQMVAENADQLTQDNDKYLVIVWNSDTVGGWVSKVFGVSRFGSYREVDSTGYAAGSAYPTREAILAAPFSVDGRVLDRSEFLLLVK